MTTRTYTCYTYTCYPRTNSWWYSIRYKMNTLWSAPHEIRAQTDYRSRARMRGHHRGGSCHDRRSRSLQQLRLRLRLFPGHVSPRRGTCSPTAYLTVVQCLTLQAYTVEPVLDDSSRWCPYFRILTGYVLVEGELSQDVRFVDRFVLGCWTPPNIPALRWELFKLRNLEGKKLSRTRATLMPIHITTLYLWGTKINIPHSYLQRLFRKYASLMSPQTSPNRCLISDGICLSHILQGNHLICKQNNICIVTINWFQQTSCLHDDRWCRWRCMIAKGWNTMRMSRGLCAAE